MNQKFLHRVEKIKRIHIRTLLLLVKDVRTTKTSIGVAILTSVQNFGYYGIMIWLPNFLRAIRFPLTKSGLWTAVTVCGMMVGIWLFGRLADKIGRKPTFILFQVCAVPILIYSQPSDPTAMLFAGAILGALATGKWMMVATVPYQWQKLPNKCSQQLKMYHLISVAP